MQDLKKYVFFPIKIKSLITPHCISSDKTCYMYIYINSVLHKEQNILYCTGGKSFLDKFPNLGHPTDIMSVTIFANTFCICVLLHAPCKCIRFWKNAIVVCSCFKLSDKRTVPDLLHSKILHLYFTLPY